MNNKKSYNTILIKVELLNFMQVVFDVKSIKKYL